MSYVPASPVSLQPPALADLVEDVLTSFALSLLLLHMPGYLQTYALVPPEFNVFLD